MGNNEKAVVDPTLNVQALNEASVKRQDDIFSLNNERIASEIRRLDAEQRHIAELAILRAEHLKELRTMSDSAQKSAEGRITALEKSAYEGKGKDLMADPIMASLVQEIKSLGESRTTTKGRQEGSVALWGMIVGGAAFILLLVKIIEIVMTFKG